MCIFMYIGVYKYVAIFDDFLPDSDTTCRPVEVGVD